MIHCHYRTKMSLSVLSDFFLYDIVSFIPFVIPTKINSLCLKMFIIQLLNTVQLIYESIDNCVFFLAFGQLKDVKNIYVCMVRSFDTFESLNTCHQYSRFSYLNKLSCRVVLYRKVCCQTNSITCKNFNFNFNY